MAEEQVTRLETRVLGDINAEEDPLLATSFFATKEYQVLDKATGTMIAVGRRGSGKTALATQLGKDVKADKNSRLIAVAPEPDEMLLLRRFSKGLKASYQKSMFRRSWLMAFISEAMSQVASHYKIRNTVHGVRIKEHLGSSRANGVVSRAHQFLAESIGQSTDPDEVLHKVISGSGQKDAIETLTAACQEMGVTIVLIVDRIDEGYEPDEAGTAITSGLVAAALDMGALACCSRAIILIRDNMDRALAKHDTDYARVVESKVLRLHWGEQDLFSMVAQRIRVRMGLPGEATHRECWNALVTRDLIDMAGFRLALYHTLHRPRDILLLLNRASYESAREGGSRIALTHLQVAAQGISDTRLNDLIREYGEVAPAIKELVGLLVGQARTWPKNALVDRIEELRMREGMSVAVAQDLRLQTSEQLLRVMYEAGLIGVRDKTSGRFLFCYDGFSGIRELGTVESLMVHPCFWLALQAKDETPDLHVEGVSDEYEIRVLSPSRERRNQVIGQLTQKLANIPPGQNGAAAFEDWCLHMIQLVFAGNLSNIEAKPNRDAPNRRDIVACNDAQSTFWSRVKSDYGSRQVVFEIKNYGDPDATDIRQVLDYLSGHYGSIGFIICRGADETLKRGALMERIKAAWHEHRKVVIVVGDKWLRRLLEKLRNPEKQNYPDEACAKLLDSYERQWR